MLGRGMNGAREAGNEDIGLTCGPARVEGSSPDWTELGGTGA